MFLKISQNSQENTCARVSFFNKQTLLKKETQTQVCEIFKNTFFTEHLQATAFVFFVGRPYIFDLYCHLYSFDLYLFHMFTFYIYFIYILFICHQLIYLRKSMSCLRTWWLVYLDPMECMWGKLWPSQANKETVLQ